MPRPLCPSPMPRLASGGSSVNGMIYMRGQARDYGDWETEHGCTGWRYNDVLPVFKRQEGNRRIADAFHGQDGPLTVDGPSAPHPVSAPVIEAAVSAGVPRTGDFNRAQRSGSCGRAGHAASGQSRGSSRRGQGIEGPETWSGLLNLPARAADIEPAGCRSLCRHGWRWAPGRAV